MMYTGKVDHRFSDKVSLNGFYLYNKTDEPCANYVEPGDSPNRFIDNGDYLLARRVHLLALNNTWLPNSNTVVTLRYGYDAVPRRRHALDRLQSGDARLRLGLQQRHPDGEVPERRHHGLLRPGRHRPVRPQPLLVERQRDGLEADQPPHREGGL